MVERIFEFWTEGEPELLRDLVPDEIFDRVPYIDIKEYGTAVRAIISGIGARSPEGIDFRILGGAKPADVEAIIDGASAVGKESGETVVTLLEIYRMLCDKYETGKIEVLGVEKLSTKDKIGSIIGETGDRWLVFDSYRRFLEYYSSMVHGIDVNLFKGCMDRRKEEHGYSVKSQFTGDQDLISIKNLPFNLNIVTPKEFTEISQKTK